MLAVSYRWWGMAVVMVGVAAASVGAQQREARLPVPKAPTLPAERPLVAAALAAPLDPAALPAELVPPIGGARDCFFGSRLEPGPCEVADFVRPRFLPINGVERTMLTGADWFVTRGTGSTWQEASATGPLVMHRALKATQAKVDADFQSAARQLRRRDVVRPTTPPGTMRASGAQPPTRP